MTERLLRLTINGRPVTAVARPNTTLLSLLRDTLGMTGTKCGCGEGTAGRARSSWTANP